MMMHFSKMSTLVVRPVAVRMASRWFSLQNQQQQQHDESKTPSTISKASLPLFGSAVGLFSLPSMLMLDSATTTATTATAVAATASKTALVGPIAAKVLALLPPPCMLFLIFSPFSTIRTIQAEKQTGDLNPLPFVSLASNCCIWTMYGVMVADLTVILPNLIGAVAGLWYTWVFTKNTHMNMMPYLGTGGALVASMAACALFLEKNTALNILGLTGDVAAVIMLSSPLAVVKTVIAQKSTAAMPFAISLGSFVNSLTWAMYGFLVMQDPYIWVPNALGLMAASIQMSLFAKYGIQKPNKSK